MDSTSSSSGEDAPKAWSEPNPTLPHSFTSPSDAPKLYPDFMKKKGIPPHMAASTKPRKHSSTSTLFIDSSISKPKNAELIHCMAQFWHGHISTADKATPELRKEFEIFDEQKHPLTSKFADVTNVPSAETIEKYIRGIFKIGQLAPETLIMAVAYFDRIVENTKQKFALFPFNWRRVILECLILASKVWEDQAVWNVDFLDLFPLATTHDLGDLEKKILSLLKFDVGLKASTYAKIYFDLRAKDPLTGEHFQELQPLTKEGEERLELCTSKFETEITKKRLHKSSGSVDDLLAHAHGATSPRSVIN